MAINIEYVRICDEISLSAVTSHRLNTIKENFLADIDSARTYDKIKNLRGLIKILEKRDCLNEGNVEALRIISRLLHRGDCILDIDNYISNRARPVDMLNLPRLESANIQVLPPVSRDPIERVYDLLSSQLGHRWKDFARHLGITEGQIDNLESAHRGRIPPIVREILLNHRASTDRRYWKMNLFNGLNKCRRADLSLQVQEILAAHSLL